MKKMSVLIVVLVTAAVTLYVAVLDSLLSSAKDLDDFDAFDIGA